jgi:hypothetical protein
MVTIRRPTCAALERAHRIGAGDPHSVWPIALWPTLRVGVVDCGRADIAGVVKGLRCAAVSARRP